MTMMEDWCPARKTYVTAQIWIVQDVISHVLNVNLKNVAETVDVTGSGFMNMQKVKGLETLTRGRQK